MLTVAEMDQTEFTFRFDKNNPQFTDNAQYNLLFLKAQLNYACDTLSASKGPLFLNEVLDMLSLPRVRAGQVLGWKPGSKVRMETTQRGNDIDFRIFVDGIVLSYL